MHHQHHREWNVCIALQNINILTCWNILSIWRVENDLHASCLSDQGVHTIQMFKTFIKKSIQPFSFPWKLSLAYTHTDVFHLYKVYLNTILHSWAQLKTFSRNFLSSHHKSMREMLMMLICEMLRSAIENIHTHFIDKFIKYSASMYRTCSAFMLCVLFLLLFAFYTKICRNLF